MPRLPRSARHQLFHLRLLWQAAPALSLTCLALAILQALAAVAAMISSGRLLGAIAATLAGAGDPAQVWVWLTATAVALVAGPLLSSISGGVEELTGARYLSAYQDLLLDTAARPYSVAALRSAAGAQALDQAAEALQHWMFLRGLRGLWGVISSRLAGLGALVIVVSWRWWVALVLLAAWLLVSRALAHWRSVVFDDTEGRAVPLHHRASYLYGLAAGRPSAKEVRLFGLADWLVGGYVSLRDRAMATVTEIRGVAVRRTVLPLLLLLVLHLGVFAVLTSDALAGGVSVAALVTIVQALLAMSVFGRQDDDETSLGRTVTELSRLVEFRSSLGLPFPAPPPEKDDGSFRSLSLSKGRARGPGTSHQETSGLPFDRLRERKPSRPDHSDRESPKSPAARIELRGVTFGYPGSDSPVLEELELIIEPGECVAIVGPNGAGKSTLLSLLCGLWSPDAGTIRIDGHDPAVDPLARARIAPIFQHFLRLPLTVTENVIAGNRWRPDTDWTRAAADSGADTVIAELPGGPETVLSPEFTGGTNLSGGQWQRIALARALTAIESGAGLLALDEPTAALDVRAEVALFESVLRHRGRATTVLITHRLSSVRHADRIVVLGRPADGGGARVIEMGGHAELIRAGGSYARMFGLQAARFRGETR